MVIETLARPEDLDRFIVLALAELHGLDEGNIARFRMRPSMFRLWRSE